MEPAGSGLLSAFISNPRSGTDLVSTRNSPSNSLYGLLEYIALPALMLLSAPYLIHQLGLPQFGVWILVSAIIGSMGTLSAGFGAATIKYVAASRGKGDRAAVDYVIRSTLTINLILGAVLSLIVWMGASNAALHIFKIEPSLQHATVLAIRIAAVIVLIRFAEGVFASALRAFERYGPAVLLNVLGRALAIAAAILLASFGIGIVGIMQMTLLITSAETVLLTIVACRIVGPSSILPVVKNIPVDLLSYGFLTWIQALAGIVFSYADRFVVGALLGTSAIAYYAVCVQATQPIHGLVAAGFNFLFPHLSFDAARQTAAHNRGFVRWAVLANVVAVVALCVPAVVFGNSLLRIWMGPTFAAGVPHLLPVLAFSFGALALNVVPYYALLAMGQARLVTILNLIGGIVTIALAAVLIPSVGLIGAAVARLFYGPITWISYFKLRQLFSTDRHVFTAPCTSERRDVQYGADAMALESDR